MEKIRHRTYDSSSPLTEGLLLRWLDSGTDEVHYNNGFNKYRIVDWTDSLGNRRAVFQEVDADRNPEKDLVTKQDLEKRLARYRSGENLPPGIMRSGIPDTILMLVARIRLLDAILRK